MLLASSDLEFLAFLKVNKLKKMSLLIVPNEEEMEQLRSLVINDPLVSFC